MTQRIAIVTGGNRGIGLEICRQLARKQIQVILTSRDEAKGKAAAAELANEGQVSSELLDVADPASVLGFCERIQRQYGQIDILVNNAGIAIDQQREQRSVFNVELATIQETFATNVYGPLQLIQGLFPLMRQGGRIVNLSSGLGQLSEMGGGNTAYRLSKVALNALTKIVDAELHEAQIKINSVCPGWVRTEMGGAGATRSVEQGADTAVWLATLPEDGPSGGFFRDRQKIDW
jgi:NAD(P)-dependent dehydrogenase (short-subunit alcohol dehydrogenase family)